MNQLDQNQERPAPAGAQQGQMVNVAMPNRAPYVTYTLIVITVLFYMLQMASEYILGTDVLIAYGARYNEAIQAGQLWRFLTPALLHASIPHILFNMYALFSFGTGLERHFGHGRFLLLYVLAAYTGNVVSFLLSGGYSVGASTAIFGLLGAEAIFLFQNKKLFAGQFSRAIQNVVFIGIVNLIIGLQPGIDNWGTRRRPARWCNVHLVRRPDLEDRGRPSGAPSGRPAHDPGRDCGRGHGAPGV